MKAILRHYSILYAEDDNALQQSTSEYLQRYFKEVHVASDGAEALKLYKNVSTDVLLLDIDMPHVDGLKVARKIREENDTIPIMMLTAFTDTQILLEATELNLCKYLVKPIAPKAFKEALQLLARKLQKQSHTWIHLPEDYRWEVNTQTLYKEHTPLVLSQKEQVLLSLFMKYYNQCVTFEEIMATVWVDSFDTEVSIESVKYQVSQLRKKLPQNCIQNVYAKGYKLK